MATALITGASRGLGAAVARELAGRGWNLIVDARDEAALRAAVAGWPAGGTTTVLAGDVTDPRHRDELAAAARRHGGLDVLLNNASTLGPSPLPRLADLPLAAFRDILEANTLAPIGLIQSVLPELLRVDGTIVNLTSDAAVQRYETWGGYGSSKAALDQATNILAAEHPQLAVYAFDPGDMRTAMHQDAFPGEDISDRPEPETVVPALLALLERRPASGRYAASDLVDQHAAAAATSGGGRS